METVRRVALELGFLGSIGAGVFTAAHLARGRPALESPLLAHTRFVRASPLAPHVVELAALGDAATHARLVRECDRFLELVAADAPSATRGRQFKAHRAMADVDRLCRRLVDGAKEARDHERVHAAILSTDDAIPALLACMNTMLQNMLTE